MAHHAVTLECTLDPGIDAAVVGERVMADLGDLGADSPVVTATSSGRLQVELEVEADGEAQALYRAAHQFVQSLDREPVHDVTARVTVDHAPRT